VRILLRLGAVLLIVLVVACSSPASPSGSPIADTLECPADSSEVSTRLEIIGSIPHRGAVWTEGLLLDEGLLWESTGEPTGSGVRTLDPTTGDVLWTVSNGEAFFAEGLARAFGRTYVLSYREGVVYTFDRSATPAFRPFAEYDGQGWGLTVVRDSLVNSNGSSMLYYRDPETFDVRKTVEITYEGEPVQQLNELEYDGRYIWANQWLTSYVYRIDEEDPCRVVRYELPGLCRDGHLNGIAWDTEEGVSYVTGQKCARIWKVRFH
jgi:glutamine cyclotransferase